MNTAEITFDFLNAKEGEGYANKTLGKYRWAFKRLAVFQELPTEPQQIRFIMAKAQRELGPESCGMLYDAVRLVQASQCISLFVRT